MDELIDKLIEETGFDWCFIKRKDGQDNVVIYNYRKSGVLADGTRESSNLEFYLLLVCSKGVNKNISAIETALYNNNFKNIKVNAATETTDNKYQVSITATKIMK